MFLILILFVIAVIVIMMLWPEEEKHIAIAQFGNEKFGPQVEDKLLAIADWYEFAETANADEEIQDLKDFYEVILEIK